MTDTTESHFEELSHDDEMNFPPKSSRRTHHDDPILQQKIDDFLKSSYYGHHNDEKLKHRMKVLLTEYHSNVAHENLQEIHRIQGKVDWYESNSIRELLSTCEKALSAHSIVRLRSSKPHSEMFKRFKLTENDKGWQKHLLEELQFEFENHDNSFTPYFSSFNPSAREFTVVFKVHLVDTPVEERNDLKIPEQHYTLINPETTTSI